MIAYVPVEFQLKIRRSVFVHSPGTSGLKIINFHFSMTGMNTHAG